ncbi:MAG TPA: addiction module protein [Ottowia sp.]|nr:addiction module protein [Ottowia sp.]
MGTRYRQLQAEERMTLASLLQQGMSLRAMGRRMGRSAIRRAKAKGERNGPDAPSGTGAYHGQAVGRVLMPDLVAELAGQARRLPVEERSRLVDLLLETLHESPIAEVEAAWAKEIERRVAAYERGEVETFDAADVFAEARHIAP